MTIKPKPIDYDDMTPQQIESQMRYIQRKRDAANEALEVAKQRVRDHDTELDRASQALIRKTTSV